MSRRGNRCLEQSQARNERGRFRSYASAGSGDPRQEVKRSLKSNLTLLMFPEEALLYPVKLLTEAEDGTWLVKKRQVKELRLMVGAFKANGNNKAVDEALRKQWAEQLNSIWKGKAAPRRPHCS